MMNIAKLVSVGIFLCTLVLLGWSPPGSAGIVLIGGDDADEDGHCYRDLGGGVLDGTLCGSLYPNAFKLALSSSTSPGSGIVAIGGANCGTAGKALKAWNQVSSGGPGALITHLDSVAEISSVNLSDFAMIYIPSVTVQLGGFCGLEPFQLVELNKLKSQIQTFVNVTGGSIIALTEADAPNKPVVIDPWGWLPFPFVTLNADFSNVMTTVNMASISPTTTDSNLSHCCFHNVFDTPLPSGFLSLANSTLGGNKDPVPGNLGKPTYVFATIISPENCTDGIDNDQDGMIDKDDSDCLICGDGIVDPPIEQCDDGNLAPGDGCDQFCQSEGQPDTDGDGVPDEDDICPNGDDNVDSDLDFVPDFCDPCPLDPNNDADGDGVCGDADICPGGDDLLDSDFDGTPDACDVCPSDFGNDADADGICESADNCEATWNPDQADSDGDGYGDVCDLDNDNDGVPDTDDNCPFDANSSQDDFDGDGVGDICDHDFDGDGVIDSGDQCLNTMPGDVVNESGCSIVELCPCEHPDGGNKWKNHGAYVSCVAHVTHDFLEGGIISELQRVSIVSEAGQSECGHKH